MQDIHRFQRVIHPDYEVEEEKQVIKRPIKNRNVNSCRFVLIAIFSAVGIVLGSLLFMMLLLKYGFPDDCYIQSFFNTPCFNQKTYGDKCTNSYQCNISQSLTCDNGNCICDSTVGAWSSAKSNCVPLASYSQSCTQDSDCNQNVGLICNSGNACNCPQKLSSGKCDCTKVSGNENFWDGSKCTTASVYGKSCTADYMCQTLTQLTYCDTTNKKCSCASNSDYRAAENKCISCDKDWFFSNFRCIRVSTKFGQNCKQNDIDTGCELSKYQLSSVSLAKVDTTDVINYVDTTKSGSSNYWVDAQLVSGSAYTSNDGTWSPTSWCGGEPKKTFVYIDAKSGICYKTENNCNVDHHYVCEYDL